MMEQNPGLCTFCGLYESTTSFCSYDEAAQKFIQQIGAKHQNLSISVEGSFCWDCFSGIVNTVEYKKQVDELEQDLRSLQRIMLNITQQLASVRNNYLTETTKLERKIKSPELKVGNMQNSSAADYAIKNGVVNALQPTQPLQTPDVTTAPVFAHSENGDILRTEKNTIHSISEKLLSPQTTNAMAMPSATYLQEPIDFSVSPILKLFSENMRNDQSVAASDFVPSWCATSNDANGAAGSTSAFKNNIKPTIAQQPVKRSKPDRLKCSYCTKTFTQPGYLIRHEQIHKDSQRKRYQCPDCKKGFVQSAVYEVHRRLHKGKAPYSSIGFLD